MTSQPSSPLPDHRSAEPHELSPLADMVAALPEMYQPIFGHPEFTRRPTRLCEDRLQHITAVYRAIEKLLSRPLRVLDLGSAQGYFSFHLAKCGAKVDGVELQAANIALCTRLAAENPDCDVHFHAGLIEEALINLAQKPELHYDLVLGLSVMHHSVHMIGADNVRKMLALLARISGASIFELAGTGEPTARAASQPENPRDLIQGYAFDHELATLPTHLPGITRPLYIASNHYWFFDGQAGRFDSWRTYSHDLAKGAMHGTRRYFFGPDSFIKLCRIDHPETGTLNQDEYANEVALLTAPPPGFAVPHLRSHGSNPHENWLLRELWPGELLLEKLQTGKSFKAETVVGDILDQLTALEQAGLYCNDLRVWNVLINDEGRARLIDFGAIGPKAADRGWPYDLFLSFIIFLHDVLAGTVSVPDPVRQPFFNPHDFPEPYRHALWKLYETDPAAWRFALLRDALRETQREERGPIDQTSFAKVTAVLQKACAIHQNAAHYWRKHFTATSADQA